MNQKFFSWSADPVMLDFGLIAIRWYGAFFALSFVFGYYLVTWMFKREGKPTEELDILLTYMFFGTLLGARLGHCLFYEPDYFLSNPLEILKIWNGGLASHGAVIGVLLSLYIYKRKHLRENYLWLLDRMCIVVPPGGFLIRLGNFFNSEIIGKPTNNFMGVIFERVSKVPRHPTQLYESFSYLLVFFIILAIYKTKLKFIQKSEGFLFGVFLILVFGVRFLIEFTKEAQTDFDLEYPINMGQLLSIPLIVIGIILIVRSLRLGTRHSHK